MLGWKWYASLAMDWENGMFYIYMTWCLISVLTDSVLKEGFSISNAQCVIHFDLPPKKDMFNNRLWCMRENFNLPLAGKQVIMYICIHVYPTNEVYICFKIVSRNEWHTHDTAQVYTYTSGDTSINKLVLHLTKM